MELTKLLNSVKVIQVSGETLRREVSSVHFDSRRVGPYSLYVAVKGLVTDGHRFVMDAITNGACAIVVEDEAALPSQMAIRMNVVKIVVKDTRRALAEFAGALYGTPSERLNLIGVTGTKGKTTTTYLIKSALSDGDDKGALIGSIANFVGDTEYPATHTTPESPQINDLLRRAFDAGYTFGVMEASSHSLSLQRVHKLRCKVAVFTNLGSDHLDFHKTREDYLAAKKILFDGLDQDAFALINADDENSPTIVKDTRATVKSYGFAEGADFRIIASESGFTGTRVAVLYSGTEYTINSQLPGHFNSHNLTAAFAVGIVLGKNPETVIAGIETLKSVPGRFNVVSKGDRQVVIDFSHTTESLEQALISLRKLVGQDRELITVFGCGGERDKFKRPAMGRVASEMSTKIIITSDNPRGEEPMSIINDILNGISANNYVVVPDRREAIKRAILESSPNAVILLAGKGNEPYQIIGDQKLPFLDEAVAQEFLNEV